MKRRKIIIISVIILFLVIAALYIYIYTIPEITGALKKTYTVEYGEMKIVQTVDAVLVREETVYTAESSGSLSYYVANNTKTRKDINILDIYGSDKTHVICPQTGVVSYYYDGYESIITPGAINNIKALLPSEGAIEVKDLTAKTISSNEPLYKLITSDSFDTVFFISPDDVNLYQVGSSVELEFETGSVEAKISAVIPLDENGKEIITVEGEEPAAPTEYLIDISTSKYFADYDKMRQCKVDVVLQNDKGLIIPNSAVAKIDGNPGVYVKGIDGEYDFTRIKVINTDGENSVVYADTFSVLREDGLSDTFTTISIYDEILKDASGEN